MFENISNGEWLLFFGSIIGGFFTLIAVWLTIHHSNKLYRQQATFQQEAERSKVIPYLILNPIFSEEKIQTDFDYFTSQEELANEDIYKKPIYFDIVNHGNGILKNMNLEIFTYEDDTKRSWLNFSSINNIRCTDNFKKLGYGKVIPKGQVLKDHGITLKPDQKQTLSWTRNIKRDEFNFLFIYEDVLTCTTHNYFTLYWISFNKQNWSAQEITSGYELKTIKKTGRKKRVEKKHKNKWSK